jgi:prevent-host-death family protein
MTTVGTFTANTHLAQLLERVAQGEKVLITRRGKPVAMLVPPDDEGEPSLAEVVQKMLEFRQRYGPRLGPELTIRDLIEEGRRF